MWEEEEGRQSPDSSYDSPRDTRMGDMKYGETGREVSSHEERRTRGDKREESRGRRHGSTDSNMKFCLRKEMAKWGVNFKTDTRDVRDSEAESPFTKEIRSANFPRRFNMSSMTPYKGHTDPKSHIEGFVLLMEVQ